MTVQTPSAPGAPSPSPTRARPSAQPAPGSPSSPGVPVPGAPVLDGTPAPTDDVPAPPGDGFQSFTGPASVRYPAPDVARGFMLLLIALANVPVWLGLLPMRTPSSADDIWVAVRAALIDQRSYPLFALLFGFGLATMAHRRIETAMRSAEGDLPPGADPRTRERHLARVREAAVVDARRLVRRRGLWMILFGAVHGTIFSGDIIGAYGIIAAIFAGTIVERKRVRMLVAGLLITAVGIYSMVSMELVTMSAADAAGAAADAAGASTTALQPIGLDYFPNSFAQWAGTAVITVLTSMALPAALLGARLADTGLLARPDRHRRALLIGGAVALAVGALGALPYMKLGAPTWMIVMGPALNSLTGLVGACGWLALLAAWAGPGTGAPLRGVRWLLSAVGRRSMTVYVGQTVLFVLVFGTLRLAGAPALDEVMGVSVAVAVWAVLAGACAWMERSGRTRGPLEILLRRAVAASARRR